MPLSIALVIGGGTFLEHHHNTQLTAARESTKAAVAAYHVERLKAIAAEMDANAANARADSIERSRAVAAPARAAVVAAAPAPCKPAIDALEAENAQLKAEAAERKDAFTQQKQATAILAPAADHVAETATRLVKASRSSFWAKLKPEVGVGGTVGVDPLTRKFSKTVGVTVSWKVL